MNISLFDEYLLSLNQYVTDTWNSVSKHSHPLDFDCYLDGNISKIIRGIIPKLRMHEIGAFFTPSNIAQYLVTDAFKTQQLEAPRVIDPTCGIGDLLIAAAKEIGAQKDLERTLQYWGKLLVGYDLIPEFIEITKLRLILTAMSYNLPSSIKKTFPYDLGDFFPGIICADINEIDLPDSDIVLANPPFNKMKAPNNCGWASGDVSQAALIISKCISELKSGTHVHAILPDVLRSGSRYQAWRRNVEMQTYSQSIELIGDFDAGVNIQVFITRFLISENQDDNSDGDWWVENCIQSSKTVGNFFNVHVGSVVPHRHPPEGQESPYLNVHDISPWETVKNITETRNFNGTKFKPPFVAVKRNSKAGETQRAVGALILGEDSVAVENHIIVLLPKNGDLKICNQLIRNLKDKRTSDWLNNRIRCRHLTTVSLSQLPWWKR